MPFQIVEGDITKQRVGAIVNAANTGLQMGGGVCGAIFLAAGARKLQAECDAIGSIKTGDAVITNGYALPADHIIHTAGPVWNGGINNEESLLRSCYQKSLALAEANGIDSIAFPLISSGIYGYPRREALEVAENAIRDYLNYSDLDMEVSLVLRNRDDLPAEKELFRMIERHLEESSGKHSTDIKIEEQSLLSYIQKLAEMEDDSEESIQHIEAKYSIAYVPEKDSDDYPHRSTEPAGTHENKYRKTAKKDLSSIGVTAEAFVTVGSFAKLLRQLLISKGIEKDADIYKKANITKDVWSKIFSKKDHIPSKRTAVAIAVALRLNIDQTLDLLKAAGYVLTNSFVFDQIIIYCIKNEVFDVFCINEILFKYEQPLLGSFSS